MENEDLTCFDADFAVVGVGFVIVDDFAVGFIGFVDFVVSFADLGQFGQF